MGLIVELISILKLHGVRNWSPTDCERKVSADELTNTRFGS
jgi:hypothetical protein